MARVLIVGEDPGAGLLAEAIAEAGHATRLVVRAGAHGSARAGTEHPQSKHPHLEPFTADPNRLGTLRGALERVTLACWLFGCAEGTPEEVRAWHGARLEAFMRQLVDSSARGFVYEAGGSAPAAVRAEGARLARDLAARNAIALAVLERDPRDVVAWLAQARAATLSLLEPAPAAGPSAGAFHTPQ